MFIDFLTVFVASVIFLVTDMFLFSSFMFRSFWEKCAHMQWKKNRWFQYVFKFVAIFCIGILLAFLQESLKVSSFWDGVIIGFLLWLGLALPFLLIVAFRQDRLLRLLCFESGIFLWNLMLMGGIIAG